MDKQKLELRWIGKEKVIQVEPRIMIKREDLSYGDKESSNLLIHGDNLLSLKSLEQEYAGKVKCIYIDPPYNTGSAYEHYDDNLEHSTWLNLMKPRLELLRNLLSEDGSIWISIDDDEQAYLKVLCDEVFGRSNFVQMVSIKRASPAGFKVVNIGPLKVTDYTMLYAKCREKFYYNQLRIPVEYDTNYCYYIKNIHETPEKWVLCKLVDLIYEEWNVSDWKEAKKKLGDNWKFIRDKALGEKALMMKDQVVSIRDPHKPSELIKEIINKSKKERDKVFVIKREKMKPIYIINGGSLAFYKDKLRYIDGILTPTEILTNFWGDINYAGIANEGNVQFKRSKKPEMLIKRIFEMSTNEGDLVLDSFLGSGTTAAVAHKMKRKWIGIELGEHAYTHCKPRLDRVIDGKDEGGITKAVGWEGGGGYSFYELASSLINIYKNGREIISKKYNPIMLAAAMCKHEGYVYAPHSECVYKQGYNGSNYIFTTTGYITLELLADIASELANGEYLNIYASKIDPKCIGRYNNISLYKIPQILLGRCEYGKINYNLNIIEQAADFEEE